MTGKTKVKLDKTGPHEQVLNDSLKALKMHQEKHFGGDAMQGNSVHLGFESRKNDFTLTKCFEEKPDIRQKFDALLVNLVAFETFICNRDPTDEECESAAEVCENWCRIYPVFFPTKGLTRKMTEYSLVFPRFIREKKVS